MRVLFLLTALSSIVSCAKAGMSGGPTAPSDVQPPPPSTGHEFTLFDNESPDVPDLRSPNETEVELFARGSWYDTDMYYGMSQNLVPFVAEVLVLNGFLGSSIYSSNTIIHIPLGICIPFGGMATINYDEAQGVLSITSWSDLWCSTVIRSRTVDVHTFVSSSFVWTNYQYTFTSAWTPLSYTNSMYSMNFFGDILDIVTNPTLFDDAYTRIYEAVENFPYVDAPAHKGVVVVRPYVQFRYSYFFYQKLLDSHFKFSVWRQDARIVPDGCEKIGNYYFKNVYTTAIASQPTYYDKMTQFACRNAICNYKTNGMCETIGTYAIIPQTGSEVYSMPSYFPGATEAYNYTYAWFTAKPTESVYWLFGAVVDAEYYYPRDSKYTTGTVPYHRDIAESRQSYYYMPRGTTTVLKTFLHFQPPATPTVGEDVVCDHYGFEAINNCYYDGTNYLRNEYGNSAFTIYSYDSYHMYCGDETVGAHTSTVQEGCYSVTTTTISATLSTFGSLSATAVPTYDFFVSSDVDFNSAIAQASSVAKQVLPTPADHIAFGFRYLDATLGYYAGYPDRWMYQGITGAGFDVAGLYPTCQQVYGRYRQTFKDPSANILRNYVCDNVPDCSYAGNNCELETEFSYETNTIDPMSLTGNYFYNWVLMTDANTVSTRNVHGEKPMTFSVEPSVHTLFNTNFEYNFRVSNVSIPVTHATMSLNTEACPTMTDSPELLYEPHNLCVYDNVYSSRVIKSFTNENGNPVAYITKFAANNGYCTPEASTPIIESQIDCYSLTIGEAKVLPSVTYDYIPNYTETYSLGAYYYTTGTIGAPLVTQTLEAIASGPAAYSFKNLDVFLYFNEPAAYPFFNFEEIYADRLYPTCSAIDSTFYKISYQQHAGDVNDIVNFVCLSGCNIEDPSQCYVDKTISNVGTDYRSFYPNSAAHTVYPDMTITNVQGVQTPIQFFFGDAASTLVFPTDLAAIPTATVYDYFVEAGSETKEYAVLSPNQETCEDLTALESRHIYINKCELTEQQQNIKIAVGAAGITTAFYGSRDFNCDTVLSTSVSTVPSCMSMTSVTYTGTTQYTLTSTVNPTALWATAVSTITATPTPEAAKSILDSAMASIQFPYEVEGVLSSGKVASYAVFTPDNSTAEASYSFVPEFTVVGVATCAANGDKFYGFANLLNGSIGVFSCGSAQCDINSENDCSLLKSYTYGFDVSYSADSTDPHRFNSANELDVSYYYGSSNVWIGSAVDIITQLPTYEKFYYTVEELTVQQRYWGLVAVDLACGVEDKFVDHYLLLQQCFRGQTGFEKITSFESNEGYYRGIVHYYDIEDINCASSELSSGYTTVTTTDSCYSTTTATIALTKYAVASTTASTATGAVIPTEALDESLQVGIIANAIATQLPSPLADGYGLVFDTVAVNDILGEDGSTTVAYDVSVAAFRATYIFRGCNNYINNDPSIKLYDTAWSSENKSLAYTYECKYSSCGAALNSDVCSLLDTFSVDDDATVGSVEIVGSQQTINRTGYNSITVNSRIIGSDEDTPYFVSSGVSDWIDTFTPSYYEVVKSTTNDRYIALVHQGESGCSGFTTENEKIYNDVVYLSTQYVLVDVCYPTTNGTFAKNIASTYEIIVNEYPADDVDCSFKATPASTVSFVQGTKTCFSTYEATYPATHLTYQSATTSAAASVETTFPTDDEAAVDIYEKLAVKLPVAKRDYGEFSGYIGTTDIVLKKYSILDEGATDLRLAGLDYIFPVVVRYWVAATCLNLANANILRRDSANRQTRAPISARDTDGSYAISVLDANNDEQLLSYICNTDACNVAGDSCDLIANSTVVSDAVDLEFDSYDFEDHTLESLNGLNIDFNYAVGLNFYGLDNILNEVATSTVSTHTMTETATSTVIATSDVYTTETYTSDVDVTVYVTGYSTTVSTIDEVEITTVYATETIVINESTTVDSTLITSVTVTIPVIETSTLTLETTLTITPISTITVTQTDVSTVLETVESTVLKPVTINYTETTMSTETHIIVSTALYTTTTTSIETLTKTKVKKTKVTETDVVTKTKTKTKSTKVTEVDYTTVTTTRHPKPTDPLPPCYPAHDDDHHNHHKKTHHNKKSKKSTVNEKKEKLQAEEAKKQKQQANRHYKRSINNFPGRSGVVPEYRHYSRDGANYGYIPSWASQPKKHYGRHRRRRGHHPKPPPHPPHCSPEPSRDPYLDEYYKLLEEAEKIYQEALAYAVAIIRAQTEALIELAKYNFYLAEIEKSRLSAIARASATPEHSSQAFSLYFSISIRMSSTASVANNAKTAFQALQTIAGNAQEKTLDKVQDILDGAGESLFNAFFN